MAIDVSEEGLELSSRDTRLLTTIGRAYYELKRYADAVGLPPEVHSLNPKQLTYYYLGRIYLDQGKLTLAENRLLGVGRPLQRQVHLLPIQGRGVREDGEPEGGGETITRKRSP